MATVQRHAASNVAIRPHPRHIGGMGWLNDNPERLDRNQRLAKQFRETTPGGRVFIVIYYAIAAVAMYYGAVWLNGALEPSSIAFGKWAASFFN